MMIESRSVVAWKLGGGIEAQRGMEELEEDVEDF